MEINHDTLLGHYILYVAAEHTYDGRALYTAFGPLAREHVAAGRLPRILRVAESGEWTGHNTKYIDDPAIAQGRLT